MTQPVQPMTDLQYPFAFNQPFSLTIGTEEKQRGFLCPSVSQPKLWNNSWCGWHSPHSTTGVHVHEQQQKTIQGLDKSRKPLHITWYLGLRQATSLREQTEQADGGIPLPWERVPGYYCLLLSFDADVHFRIGCSGTDLEFSSLPVYQGNEAFLKLRVCVFLLTLFL